MNSRFAKTLCIALFSVVASAANAQYGSPNPPADKSAATGSTSDKRPGEAEIRSYKEGRRACNNMTGAAKEACRKQLSAKYVDKQCGNLTDMKLDECLKTEYPGE